MTLIRPLPRTLTRTLSVVAVVVWIVQMGVLLQDAYSAAPVSLAADLSHYGSSAQWKGVYYRGDKIGFSVGQTTPTDEGYEIREDGRLQMRGTKGCSMQLLETAVPGRNSKINGGGPPSPGSASRFRKFEV